MEGAGFKEGRRVISGELYQDGNKDHQKYCCYYTKDTHFLFIAGYMLFLPLDKIFVSLMYISICFVDVILHNI